MASVIARTFDKGISGSTSETAARMEGTASIGSARVRTRKARDG
jgi:hypothetical protein